MSMLGKAYLNMHLKAWMAKEKIKGFFQSQDGVSNIVATIILLLIVVVLISVFWEKLSGFVKDLFDKIVGNTPSIEQSQIK